MSRHTSCFSAALVLLLLVTAACGRSAGEVPLDKDRLAAALADLHLAEGLIQDSPFAFRDSLKEGYYEHVLADHGMTPVELDSLMWIVRSDPRYIEQVYEAVNNRLNLNEATTETRSDEQ
ncbi:MAG: DUF4296 domain-containing protein [Saprospiraceae bacterium]